MKFEFSAGAAIYREDPEKGIVFLLLMKPNNEYDIPKGHIEEGETPEIAAKREITEETGLDVDFIPGFSTVTRYFFYKNKERVLKRNRIFLVKVSSPKVKISEEHKGFDWLTYEEILNRIKYKNTRKMFAEVLDYIGRYNEVRKINDEYSRLPEKSRKWDLSSRLVPGEGPLNAKVMLIGQAPGRFEDEALRPFIGRAGKVLSAVLSKARLKRDKVYITSVVQFFPPENRMPTDREVELCLPFLKRQIEAIKPSFIITLGSLSSRVLAGVNSVDKEHGKIIEENGITYMVTFHPAAALRFRRCYDIMLSDFRKFSGIIRARSEKE